MPINDMFITKSIDLHLFFMRITEEHLIFIKGALPDKYIDLINETDNLREEAVKFLNVIVSLANGYISPHVLKSNEILTKFTYDSEKATSQLTGIKIDLNLTLNENKLLTPEYNRVSHDEIMRLNDYAIDIIKKITSFESSLLKSIEDCEIFCSIYPDRLDHIIDENKNYLVNLTNLQNMKFVPSLQTLSYEIIFWNENLSDHGKYTAGLLDPKEKNLIKKANEFAEEFEILKDEAKNAKEDLNRITSVLNKSLELTIKFKEFNVHEVEGLLNCKIKSITLPLAAEHDLREVNHYLGILQEAKIHSMI